MKKASLFFVGLFLALSARDAAAYTPKPIGGCPTATFASPPQVILHTTEITGIDVIALLQLLDAMIDIHDQFNTVGATTAAVGNVTASADAFVFQNWFGDTTPTIHVGFTSDVTAAVGATAFAGVDALCNFTEVHIQFRAPSIYGWAFGEPSAYGEAYYDARLMNGGGDQYFRIAYMHELMHSFGFAHSDNSYSMLNYGDRPWANRPASTQIRPLPDDVEGLRALYPGGGSRTEIAALATWYDPTALSSGTFPAATQKRLCKPSLGDAWGGDYDNVCGTTGGAAGSTTVRAGDSLRVRFAAANYGTTSVDVEASLYFSTDDVFDAADVASTTVRTFSLSQSGSSKQGRVFSVPALAAGVYHVIVYLRATTPSGVVVSDWSPTRGTVTVL